ncbi:isoleucine--tRNA ligase [Haematomicrobium sanguinis]|uniref:isoleucine--tRNA ligase n=1 Tax=Haematomicrobium sanguinis TaxID=479106 RepID=UPI000478FDDA|nr:isoleucine--tRNA ligase [Haematomicrobium sanguinis]
MTTTEPHVSETAAPAASANIYPKVNTSAVGSSFTRPEFPVIEVGVLDYWAKDNTFQASIDNRDAGTDGANEFVFYDGPPFANGLPHYGHLLTGYAKDLIGRYQTQRGHRVERRFGWDTHGLPAELEAMKQLGMSDKAQIEEMGIDKFNAKARESVMEYADQWRAYVNRQARWVDFDNDYKTMNVEFMESVLWAFKELYKKGLVYNGYRVLPYCWNDETPLSNHELRMDDDVYQMRQDPSVTVTFPILASGHALDQELEGVNLLAWTTTPWTLPTNFSAAVGRDISYALVQAPDGKQYLLAQDLVANYAKDLGFADPEEASNAVVRHYLGRDLAGLKYQPLWDYYQDTEKWGTENAWQVLAEDYVSTTDGTGIVHQASAYGEEDQRSSEAAGIPVILSVDDGAKFLPMFGEGPLAEIVGLQVFDANRPIIRNLRDAGRLVREASYEHSYPHCWRCRRPLIYKAVTSWFVEVTKFKDRMIELNQEINWIPENVKDGQFGKWLENARDWSISRNRYWGSPIPVWVSDNPEFPRVDVYGSLAELEADFGRLPVDANGNVDLHRPFIDELTRPNPDDPSGTSTMRRVSDVMDVWFDSGSMPYAQNHYPFENEHWFNTHNPADFIVEYIGQTRGWFYMLHILSTALFDRPSFKNVISHGIILGNDGLKASKSLGNYPDVNESFDTYGSDAVRWNLMSSPILRGGNFIVTEEGIREAVRHMMLPIWNVYSFFALYTNSAAGGAGYEAQWRGSGYTDPLDVFLMSATADLVERVGAELDAYNIANAADALRSYVDVLTNWYVRRSRQRFFDESTDAFDALYTALETMLRVAAPLLPLLAEQVWRGLTGERSVHLTDWPDPADFQRDAELVDAMTLTRTIASQGLALRKAAKLRVRLPLASLTAVVPGASGLGADLREIIADELNVKDVRVLDAAETSPADFGISQQLVVNARAAGPRLGRDVQQAIKDAKSGDWSVSDSGAVVAGGLELEPGEYSLETKVENDGDASFSAAVLPGGGFLVLDTVVSPELEAEGVARDTIRLIQQARKDAGLQVSDRIVTRLVGPSSVMEAVQAHAELVKGETLSVELVLEAAGAGAEGKTNVKVRVA